MLFHGNARKGMRATRLSTLNDIDGSKFTIKSRSNETCRSFAVKVARVDIDSVSPVVLKIATSELSESSLTQRHSRGQSDDS